MTSGTAVAVDELRICFRIPGELLDALMTAWSAWSGGEGSLCGVVGSLGAGCGCVSAPPRGHWNPVMMGCCSVCDVLMMRPP
ncbi:hypothetical protein GDO81_022528 [Engystomops pustulosus]|uniref:Uncharacterized protein n=1 Tax=Engystomops pustulosus TaxID=76066 RepID=A0AAV6Z7S7_ENGPU|nr:hypothetical protein GDO81_022528 [Engystomops pustulosus]